jgi:hypothetical protein
MESDVSCTLHIELFLNPFAHRTCYSGVARCNYQQSYLPLMYSHISVYMKEQAEDFKPVIA